MDYYRYRSGVLVKSQDFDLAETLTCGQFFRYRSEPDGYWVISGQNPVFVSEFKDAVLLHNITLTEFENRWRSFFDLDRDYGEIKDTLAQRDTALAEAARFAPGIRLLNQEPWDCLLGFILSQNNRIPMIMKVMETLAERYGGALGEAGYGTPEPYNLSVVDETELRSCKTGFRAPYILDAAKKVAADHTFFDGLDSATKTLKLRLMEINGVGPKIADCVMLFSLGRREVFPADVWIVRIMRKLYFNGKDAPLADIQAMAEERFGDLAGYAQQYLYHYARTQKIA